MRRPVTFSRGIVALVCLAFLLFTPTLSAKSPKEGIEGRRAPGWGVKQWHNVGAGRRLDLGDYKNKVLCLYFFNYGCPGCHSSGFPKLKKLIDHFKNDRNVQFVAFQTAWVGFESSTFPNAKNALVRHGLSIPVGHDGDPKTGSPLFNRYRARATPWFVIVDKSGLVRFNDSHAEWGETVNLITDLSEEETTSGPTPTPTTEPTPEPTPEPDTFMPLPRVGIELIGRRLPVEDLEWLNTPDGGPVGAGGGYLLVRWWTEGCPHCVKSLPTLERFKKKLGKKGVRTVAVYHQKSETELTDEEIVAEAERLRYTGPVARDPEWRVLTDLYLSGHKRPATSVTFLLDADKKIRFVHPGPLLCSSPEDPLVNDDYTALGTALQTLLRRKD